MKVVLLNSTPDPDMTCAIAASVCYSEHPADELADMKGSGRLQVLRNALASGHESVAEHASFTFSVSGVSRALSHQLVRHRVASYSQQSQRYVNMKGCFDYVTPPEIERQPYLKQGYDKLMMNLQRTYDNLIEIGYIQPEDARYILPNAICTNIVVTMNARELRHFFNLRCCNRAQWEIRQLADSMLAICKEVAPVLFETAGAPCTHGKCPEGARSCGKPRGQRNDRGM